MKPRGGVVMNKVAEIICRIQLVLGVVCLCVFFISVLIQIFSRQFSISVRWTEDACAYPFIWAVFLGAAAMVYQKGHFCFDFLSRKIPPAAISIQRLIIDFVMLSFSVSMTYYGIVIAVTFWNYTWPTIPAIKMGYTWLILPITGSTMSYYLLCSIVNNIKSVLTKRRNQ
jgi:TRAP-type C4-dicarboxylate transport system permease small subunit